MKRTIGLAANAVVLLAACGHPSAPPSGPTTSSAGSTVKRTYISLGRASGWQTTTRTGNRISTTFHVLENGRGPHVEATIVLGDDGAIDALEANGHHTMGTLVAEKFTRKAGHASWHSEEEQGERDVAAPAMFMPQGDVPEVEALLVQAALAHGGTFDLLPTGTARIDKVTEHELTIGGETRKLVGYTITGLGFSPKYTWLNPDGSWFGAVDAWSSLVPAGWESAVPELVAVQQRLTRERDAANAKTQAHRPPAAGLAFTHARVLDIDRGAWLPDQTVVIVGDKITAVGKGIAIPAGAEVVDATGRAIIPGLVDMHAHLGDDDGVLNIASGVTTVRDVGNDPDKLDDLKQRWDAGDAIGPHVFRMGLIEGRNEKAASSKVTAETEAEAKAAVKFYADRKYDGIKIYNSIRAELIPILAADAHARGMKVTGHIPVHVLANEAVRAGYDGIEHVNMLFLNFLATHDTDTRDTTRFTLVGDKAHALDFASSQVKEFIALLASKKTVIDPTLATFEDLFTGVPGKVTAGVEGIVHRLPVLVQRGFLGGGLPLSGDKHELYVKSYAKMLSLIKLLRESGITVVAGTDHIAGVMLHHELALFVRAGLPPAEAIRMATRDAARALGADATFGSIAVGKRADLIVIDGDPLANIGDVTKIVTTVKAGTVFSSPALYRLVGVTPAVAGDSH